MSFKITALNGLVKAQPQAADLSKFASLEVGQTVATLAGPVFRVISKTTGADATVLRLANLAGKPVDLTAEKLASLRPISPLFARIAARFRFLGSISFNTIIHEALKQAGIPIDPKMNWDGWFQTTYVNRLYNNTDIPKDDKEMAREVAQEVVVKELWDREALSKMESAYFSQKPWKPLVQYQNLPLAQRASEYLKILFGYRYSDAVEIVRRNMGAVDTPAGRRYKCEDCGKEFFSGASKAKLECPECHSKNLKLYGGVESMSVEDTEQSEETNALDTLDQATAPNQEEAIQWEDINRFSKLFEGYLKEQRGKLAKGLTILWDLIVESAVEDTETSHSKRNLYSKDWEKATGLGHDAFKSYLQILTNLFLQYIDENPDFEEKFEIVRLVKHQFAERFKERHAPSETKASLASLHLADVEQDPLLNTPGYREWTRDFEVPGMKDLNTAPAESEPWTVEIVEGSVPNNYAVFGDGKQQTEAITETEARLVADEHNEALDKAEGKIAADGDLTLTLLDLCAGGGQRFRGGSLKFQEIVAELPNQDINAIKTTLRRLVKEGLIIRDEEDKVYWTSPEGEQYLESKPKTAAPDLSGSNPSDPVIVTPNSPEQQLEADNKSMPSTRTSPGVTKRTVAPEIPQVKHGNEDPTLDALCCANYPECDCAQLEKMKQEEHTTIAGDKDAAEYVEDNGDGHFMALSTKKFVNEMKSLLNQYGFVLVSPGVYEAEDLSDYNAFNTESKLTKFTVTVDGVAELWTLNQEFDDGDKFSDSGDDPIEIEYYLDPGSLQDEGFEREGSSHKDAEIEDDVLRADPGSIKEQLLNSPEAPQKPWFCLDCNMPVDLDRAGRCEQCGSEAITVVSHGKRPEGVFPAPIKEAASKSVNFECLECGKKFRSASDDPRCPKCRSVDLEVGDAVLPTKSATPAAEITFQVGDEVRATIGGSVLIGDIVKINPDGTYVVKNDKGITRTLPVNALMLQSEWDRLKETNKSRERAEQEQLTPEEIKRRLSEKVDVAHPTGSWQELADYLQSVNYTLKLDCHPEDLEDYETKYFEITGESLKEGCYHERTSSRTSWELKFPYDDKVKTLIPIPMHAEGTVGPTTINTRPQALTNGRTIEINWNEPNWKLIEHGLRMQCSGSFRELTSSIKTATQDIDETMVGSDHHTYHLTTWQERDRFNINLTDETTGKETLDLWDENAIQFVEDGFFDWHNPIASVLEYAEDMGLIKPKAVTFTTSPKKKSSVDQTDWDNIRPGDRLTILVPGGLGRNGREWIERSGKVVMRSSTGGWVLNMGGPHGTPGIANLENTVKIVHKNSARQQPIKGAKVPEEGAIPVKLTVNLHGQDMNYSKPDLQDFLDAPSMYRDADNLPKWLALALIDTDNIKGHSSKAFNLAYEMGLQKIKGWMESSKPMKVTIKDRKSNHNYTLDLKEGSFKVASIRFKARQEAKVAGPINWMKSKTWPTQLVLALATLLVSAQGADALKTQVAQELQNRGKEVPVQLQPSLPKAAPEATSPLPESVGDITVEPLVKPNSEEITPPAPTGYDEGTERISPEPNAEPGMKFEPTIEHPENVTAPGINRVDRT